MVSCMSLEEQVDKDFSLARRKLLLGRIGARLRRDAASDGLLCFDDLREGVLAHPDGQLRVAQRGVTLSPG